jgi:hypothetical protein
MQKGEGKEDDMETDEKVNDENDSDSDAEPDDEHIERIRTRLPPAEDINIFLRRSLAIFMLLRLRIYLKQAYNLSDKRIDTYTNSEANANDTKHKVR